MTHVHVLVEEQSAGVALQILIPSIIGERATYRIITHSGKKDLLAKLPARLRGYRQWIGEGDRLLVLVDRDGDDCRALKALLEDAAAKARLPTRSAAGRFQILNRIAVEELEAWFLGDAVAVCTAFPRVPSSFHTRARYRDPDAVRGGTWEALRALLSAAGYYQGIFPKLEVSRKIASAMDPSRNRSRSFQIFVEGLIELVA